MPNERIALRARVQRGLRQADMTEDPEAASAMRHRLGALVQDLVAAHRLPIKEQILDKPPPRAIAVPFALAVFSQPHLVTTFAEGDEGDAAFLVTNDILEAVLGLASWELDDLRDDVDRRAREVLKQQTFLRWFTGRYTQDRQVGLLLPGRSSDALDGLVTRSHGNQLYLGSPETASPWSLYLPWMRDEQVRVVARYVDAQLKEAMVRGIGATEVESHEIVDRAITVAPLADLERWMAHDHWRASGLASLTHLGHSYRVLDWLIHQVDPSDMGWNDWNRIEAPSSLASYDNLVRIRVHHTLRAIYTSILARRSRGHERDPGELVHYDLTRHLQKTLSPLTEWTQTARAMAWLSSELEVEPDRAKALLDTLQVRWHARERHWVAPDPEALEDTAFGHWVWSIASFDAVLTELLEQPADMRFPHQRIALLFAGHFVSEQPFPQGLMTPEASAASPGHGLSRWFWRTWIRLLDAIDAMSTETTSPEFVIPDGMF